MASYAYWKLSDQGWSSPYYYANNIHPVYHATYGGPYLVAWNGVTTNGSISMIKPAGNDPSNTWSELDSANRPTSGESTYDEWTAATVEVGTKIHVHWQWGPTFTTRNMYYSRFDMSTDTWDNVDGTAKYRLLDAASSGSTWANIRSNILKRQNGNLIIGVQGDPANNKLMGGSYAHPAYFLSTDGGDTWSGPNIMYSTAELGGVRCENSRFNLGTSNRMHVFCDAECGSNCSYDKYGRHRTLRADNTLDPVHSFWFWCSPEHEGPGHAGPDAFYVTPSFFYFYWTQGLSYTYRYNNRIWYASADTLSPSRTSAGEGHHSTLTHDQTNNQSYLNRALTSQINAWWGTSFSSQIVVSDTVGMGSYSAYGFGWYDRGGTKLACWGYATSPASAGSYFTEYTYGPVTQAGVGTSTPALSVSGVGSLAQQPQAATATPVVIVATVDTFKLSLPTFVELVATPVVVSAADSQASIVRVLTATPVGHVGFMNRDVHIIQSATVSHTGSFSTGDVGGILEFTVSVAATALSTITEFFTYVNRSKTEASLGQVSYGDLTDSPQQYTQGGLDATVTTVATMVWEKIYILATTVATTASVATLKGVSLIATSITATASLAKDTYKNLSVSVVASATNVLFFMKNAVTTVTVTATRNMSFLFTKAVTVATSIVQIRDFTLEDKTTTVGVNASLTPGKIIHQLWTAVVALSPVSLVRRIYTEVHLAAVGVLGGFTKAKVYTETALATVATSATLFLARMRELATSVATSVTVGFFQQKVLRAAVNTTATTIKGIYWTILGTVGTNARRFRKFTDNYLATVGTVGSNTYSRLMSFKAVVGLRALFTRSVIKPISDFAARVVVMVKRVTNSAVIQEPTAKTLRDCGDLIVIQGESMAELNLTIKQGATFDLTLTWNDSAGNPIDLTGYTARMQIRLTQDAPDPAEHEMTTANGGIVLGGAAGTIQLIISSVDTAAFTWEEGVYDLEMISDVGPPEVVRRLLEGCVVVTPEVTR